MNRMDRREFIQGVRAALAAGMAASVPLRIANAQARRKMTISLNCGAIGVKATQIEAIEHAVRHGFESVEPLGRFLEMEIGRAHV